MQFSGKITNSVLAYLARQGWDRERVFELTEIPLEFLRDPTSWIEAAGVEEFLRAIEREHSNQAPLLLSDIGHAGVELRGWGVLDSVLRMMQKPQDLYSQPQRFLSYFISPAPPIVNLRHGDESVSFDLPIAHNEYPATVAYLTAALEALPKYWGQEPAQVNWRGTTLRISWSTAQRALLPDLEEAPANPQRELMESLVRGVEMAHAQVEARDLEIARLEQEVRELRAQVARAKHAPHDVSRQPMSAAGRTALRDQVAEIRENVLRLTDYLTRSLQALTMARMAHRQDPQVQAVLKRIDWETIRSQYPWLHLQIIEGLGNLDGLLEPHQLKGPSRAGRVAVADVMASVVERLEEADRSRLKIKMLSFVNEPLEVDVDRLHVALWQILFSSARAMGGKGEIEMKARLEQNTLEVVVEERGEGRNRDTRDLPLLRGTQEDGDAALLSATELIRSQKGSLTVSNDEPGRRQIACRWPLSRSEDQLHEHH